MADKQDVLRNWHRLFGLLLTDFFTNSPFEVEMERDLSEQQQYLDVLIVRRSGEPFRERLPDGLDDLAAHNLITFKSHHEPLDAWAMKELIGHYVAYRKLISRSPSDLLAESEFHLYAVCARYPHNLSNEVPWQERQAGVYDCRWGTDTVRVVAPGQLPQEAHNAPLHLFSAVPEVVRFGQETYRRRSPTGSTLLLELWKGLRKEGFAMTYTMADFRRDYIKKELPQLPPEERRDVLEALSAKERQELLKTLPAEERQELLKTLPVEERLAGVPLEERLAGLSRDQIQQYLERMTTGSPPKPRKRRGKK